MSTRNTEKHRETCEVYQCEILERTTNFKVSAAFPPVCTCFGDPGKRGRTCCTRCDVPGSALLAGRGWQITESVKLCEACVYVVRKEQAAVEVARTRKQPARVGRVVETPPTCQTCGRTMRGPPASNRTTDPAQCARCVRKLAQARLRSQPGRIMSIEPQEISMVAGNVNRALTQLRDSINAAAPALGNAARLMADAVTPVAAGTRPVPRLAQLEGPWIIQVTNGLTGQLENWRVFEQSVNLPTRVRIRREPGEGPTTARPTRWIDLKDVTEGGYYAVPFAPKEDEAPIGGVTLESGDRVLLDGQPMVAEPAPRRRRNRKSQPPAAERAASTPSDAEQPGRRRMRFT